MNPHWPYPQYSVPPPNFPSTYQAQPLQQNTWNPINAPPGPLPTVCPQMPANTNVIPPNTALTSVPPPPLATPGQTVVQPNYQFNVPPPVVFPTNIPPPNLFSQNILTPNRPPPVAPTPDMSKGNATIPPSFPVPPPIPVQPPFAGFPVQGTNNAAPSNAAPYASSSSIPQNNKNIHRSWDQSHAQNSFQSSDTKGKQSHGYFKDYNSSSGRNSKNYNYKDEKFQNDSYKKSSDFVHSKDRHKKELKFVNNKTGSCDLESENKDEKYSSKIPTECHKYKNERFNKDDSPSCSYLKEEDKYDQSSRSSSQSRKSSSARSVKRKRNLYEEGYGAYRRQLKQQQNESPKKRHLVRHRSSTPEDLPCLSPKAYKYVCSSLAEKYYCNKEEASKDVIAKDPLTALHKRFKYELVDRAERFRAFKPKYEPPRRKTKLRKPQPPKTDANEESSSSEKSSSEEEDTAMEELERKKKHPDRLHLELWFNDPKEVCITKFY